LERSENVVFFTEHETYAHKGGGGGKKKRKLPWRGGKLKVKKDREKTVLRIVVRLTKGIKKTVQRKKKTKGRRKRRKGRIRKTSSEKKKRPTGAIKKAPRDPDSLQAQGGQMSNFKRGRGEGSGDGGRFK